MDSRILETLSDENRVAIVELLAGGERCLCEVSDGLGISNALASHHIKRLREAGVVLTERRGAWLHCRIDAEALLALADELRDLALRSVVAPAGCCSTPAREEAAS